MLSSKTTGVINDAKPTKKSPASSILRANNQQESVHQPRLLMLHLCDPQAATSLSPSPWSLFEPDQIFENARFCGKPDQPTLHSKTAGIFDRGALSRKILLWSRMGSWRPPSRYSRSWHSLSCTETGGRSTWNFGSKVGARFEVCDSVLREFVGSATCASTR
ncbi:hypothetical protein EDD16DRAFT_1533436 [Pisolithus croceorrhizus]|nr:hypothetical protein EDD16DRAFT_1533436 [Pisolithus croceorrhizus]